MKYLPIIFLALLVGAYVYSYTQIRQLDQAMKAAESKIAALSEQLDASTTQLEERIDATTTEVEKLRASNEEGVAAVEQRLEGLEADIREDVSIQLTDKIVRDATSEAIKRVVLENLPQSEQFLITLSGVLAKEFRSELQGVPGEQVDPAVLASLLGRNDAFLDAIKFELLAEIALEE